MVALAMLHEAVAKDAPNRPYVQSGPGGVFYARCLPAAATGTSGFTEIYKVQTDRDELVNRYDWYNKHGVVLGWSPIAGKVAVMAIRPQPSDSMDKQVELGFYLGGKLLKFWTTRNYRTSAHMSSLASLAEGWLCSKFWAVNRFPEQTTMCSPFKSQMARNCPLIF